MYIYAVQSLNWEELITIRNGGLCIHLVLFCLFFCLINGCFALLPPPMAVQCVHCVDFVAHMVLNGNSQQKHYVTE